METRGYLLVDGRTMTVSVDRLTRRATFSVRDQEPLTMHLAQAFHLAKFMFGFELKEEHRHEHDDDVTKPDSPAAFDLSDQDNDPD